MVRLRPRESISLSRNPGPASHGLFLALAHEADPDLAEELHQDVQVKPFTVSSLHGRFARSSTKAVALPQEEYWVRFTTLSDRVFAAMNRALLPRLADGGSLRLETGAFDLVGVDMEPVEGCQWGGLSTFEQLWEEAGCSPDITLGFRSPTTFRQKGKNLVFPLPSNVFQGYLQKWNTFSRMPIGEQILEWVENGVAAESYRLQSMMVSFAGFQMSGFVGTCRFRALLEDAARLKELNALASFSFYCGTGAKTTMGMGQTLRMTPRYGGTGAG